MYHHGTSIENALKILNMDRFVGKKKHENHQHSYVSFSANFHISKDFGEIVFSVEPKSSSLLEVEYEDNEWIKNNQEIIEYVGVWYSSLEETEQEMHAMQFEEEYVIKDSCDCWNILKSITIIAREDEDIQETKEQLKRVVGDTIPIETYRYIIPAPSPFQFAQENKLEEMLKEIEELIG
ncbi:hypothetical protein QTG56_24625 (plasmid) [Rossellomorea sp. AcN35-11]|nr:hypothetical protein [Rossellomorea aquimaris]WJV31821.1 hypothetical protein QTG56_24625 [Rossellomorea sp. AcN35-11]